MVLLFICGSHAHSQNFEIGPYIGGANYIGDVGNSTFIRPNNLVFGGILKWNRSTRHAFRLSILHAKIEGVDAEANDRRRIARGYSFSNSITEASLGMEFTFWKWDPHSPVYQSTPYLYTGINYYHADHFRLTPPTPVGGPTPANQQLEKSGSNWGFSIPMAIGYKQSLNSFLSGAVELGFRYTFTDNLDGSQPSEIDGDFRADDFGNRNTTDWYVFTGIYITFNFGKRYCYDKF